MENPATWGPVEKAISKALTDVQRLQKARAYGLSIPRVIADALRAEGFLKDDVPDQDTSRCIYGCTSPTTCPFQHVGCAHCRRHRAGEDGPSHQHVAKTSYYCDVCGTQVAEGQDHRCPGGNR